jgi:hypothetical protein
MKKISTAAIGLFAAFMGIGLVLPALAKVRDSGVMPSQNLTPYTWGIVLVVLGLSTTGFTLMRRKTV